jgi:LuxR family maltose regulon positive regulatory protein
MGDLGGAADAIEKAKRVAQGLSPWFDAIVLANEAHLNLAGGDIAAASRWAQANEAMLNGELVLSYCSIYLVLARTLAALGKLDDALHFLARLLTMVEAAGARLYIVQILVLQAVVWRVQGKLDKALRALGRALELAEPEGLVRAFVDSGEPVRLLIAKYGLRITDRNLKSYTEKLLAAFGNAPASGQAHTEIPHPLKREIPKSEIIEPLSERELEVLRLLVSDLSSTEIADVLFISANTVRSHIKNIYGKLNVHQRDAALERAKELGLL